MPEWVKTKEEGFYDMTLFEWMQECFFREAMQIIPDNPAVIQNIMEEREDGKNGEDPDRGSGPEGAGRGQWGHEWADEDSVQKRIVPAMSCSAFFSISAIVFLGSTSTLP